MKLTTNMAATICFIASVAFNIALFLWLPAMRPLSGRRLSIALVAAYLGLLIYGLYTRNILLAPAMAFGLLAALSSLIGRLIANRRRK